ncbi:hypothetical protein Leryth_025071 [Lithospermum erythrorhizon]|nr:hypothetical protein Leryth_025071 [Lithospermum erythrorhizon]
MNREELVKGHRESMDESNISNDSEDNCSYHGPTLPVCRKILDLSDKVQILKQDHEALCKEVKGITSDSFPGSEALTTLQNLNEEHEILKMKYHDECELLKKKYLEEYSERKRLYNEMIELKGNIRVFCRCRPLNGEEIANGYTSVVDLDSCQENEIHILCSDSSRKQFKFDHVFRPEDNQDAVFVQTRPVVTSVLDGYNACIFAYGQTGTGKTYTMEGTQKDRGVNYRTLEELFRVSEERSSSMRYELLVSMLEVYNEKIRDLLVDNPGQNAKKLEIKQSAEGTQEVPGLVEATVRSTTEVWELLKTGSQARSVGSTNANELSSRSHCLLRVTAISENKLNGHKTRSHLWLVDLAGSERLGRTEVQGERLKESQFINKSLSALGDVISALASKSSHIPYRNSKLTHVLQSSLGGDCKTLMFVQVSPSSADLGETLCSLNFAIRVRGVEHGPARKQTDVSELLKYKQLAEKAKHDEKETKKLQDNVQSLQLRLLARDHTVRTLQEKVKDLENQLEEERKTRLKQQNRALSAVSTQLSFRSSLNQLQKRDAEQKPPLAPSKVRLPLRRISNFVPPASSPAPSSKPINCSYMPARGHNKENHMSTTMDANNGNKFLRARRSSFAAMSTQPSDQSHEQETEPYIANKGKLLLRARRGSLIPKPTAQSIKQTQEPRRRASIATTLHMEPSSNIKMPLNSSDHWRNDRVRRQTFIWDPKRVWRTTRAISPMPKLDEGTYATTPVGASSSSKFMGSPLPSQQDSSKPTRVVALAKKQHLVWSPLRSKVERNNRKSLLAT